MLYRLFDSRYDAAMSIKSDRWIKEMSIKHKMIQPFVDKQMRKGVVSYGVSSYGYDIRVADEFAIFSNVNTTIIDPKNFDPRSLIHVKAKSILVPPNSFALARTVEYFKIPRNVLTLCLGKCLPASARVVDAATGDVISIKQFVQERRSSVASLNMRNHRLVKGQVSRHVNQGVKPIYRLTTKTGRMIEATSTHPFLKFEGWTSLKKLAVGDRIAVPRTLPFFGSDAPPDHQMDLLGLMISDGQCHTPGHSPRYTTGDAVLKAYFGRAAEAFGCMATTVGHFSQNICNRKGRGGIQKKNRFYQWLEELELNVGSHKKFVPSIVWRAPKTSAARFLRALFSGDGSVYQQENAVFLEYASVSERLIRDVHHLLLRFGIVGFLDQKKTNIGTTAYRVVVTTKDQVLVFAKEIGFVAGSEKQHRLEEAVEYIRAHPQKKSNYDTLPKAAWASLRGACVSAGRSLHSLGVLRTSPGQSVPRRLMAEVGEQLNDESLRQMAASDILWDVVESIAPAGRQEVFDLSVPGFDNFIANDFIVHNSTYARCGIIVNVTPFEPEWEGHATLEISNTTPIPAKIYANEGIAQVLFFEGDEPPQVSYADKKGKYQKQRSITLPRI